MTDQVDNLVTARSGRAALLVATSTYTDPRLRPLVAPEPDALALAKVLSDKDIGAFDVQTIVNQPAHLISRAIERHLTGRRLDDFVLLHMSCHGIKDADGQLYFAASDTDRDLVASTTVSAAFLRDQLNRSRARTILILLDCCYSGAFVSGIRGDADVHLAEQLLQKTPGRGRVVITASDAIQYAWEEDGPAGDGQPGGFTAALIRGLNTGEADVDGDGQISINELFDYLYEKVQEVRTDQQPRKWEFGVQGSIWIAHVKRPTPVPDDDLDWIARMTRPAPSLEDQLILLVDDDRDLVRFIEVTLRLEGFEVVTAHNGDDGLAKALDLEPSLIVLDVMMPRRDGYEVCTQLRADDRGRRIPIIFLTAKSLSADKVLGITAGADDYITKPFDPMELVARIKATLWRKLEYEALGAQRATSGPK